MKFIPDRLKSARMINGMSLQSLAEKITELGFPITKQTINKYELGDYTPNSEMVGQLSKVLMVRPNYFFNEFEIVFDDINYRKLEKYSTKEEQRIIELTKNELGKYIELENLLNLEAEFTNPLSDFQITDFKSVDNAAEKVRHEWKLGLNPIPNSIEILEENNIKVIEVESDVDLDGFSTIANKKYPVVILNKTKLDDKTDRKRWTALHELGHIVLNLDHLDGEKQKEKYCHYFAGAMLFPKEIMIKELGKQRNRLSFQELAALKEEYGISMQGIVYRAKDLGIISESSFRQFYQTFTRLGYKINEPAEYYGKEESHRFEQLLFRALVEEVITMNKAASLKNQSLADFRKEYMVL